MGTQDRFPEGDSSGITKIPFKPVEAPNGVTDYRSVPVWQFLHDAYHGVGGFLGKAYTYLVADRTENFFNTRVKMTHYINELARYIVTQFKGVYTGGFPQYKTADTGLESMLKDIDRRGSSIDDLKKYGTANCLLSGTVFIASGNDGVAGKQPWNIVYTAIMLQEDMCEYDIFRNITKYVFYVGDYKYHVYTDEAFKILVNDKKKEDVKLSELTEELTSDVPEQVVRPIRSIPHFGQDVLPVPQDTVTIARQSLNLLELRSRMIQVMTRQLFDRLVVTGSVDTMAEGVTNLTVLNGDNASAQLLSPDAKITEVWNVVIETFTSLMYEHMRDGGVIAVRSTQIPESGASKAYTFMPVREAHDRSTEIGKLFDAYAEDSHNLWMEKSAKLEVKYKEYEEPKAAMTPLDIKDYVEVLKGLELNEMLKEVAKTVMSKFGIDAESDTGMLVAAEIEAMRKTLSE